MQEILSEIVFLFQRFDWFTVVDLLLVSLIFYSVLRLLRNTKGRSLLRGVVFVAILIMLLTTLVNLPAFSFLANAILPALLFSIPVIFAPEIRRMIERIGRAGPERLFSRKSELPQEQIKDAILAVSQAAKRLSELKQGALIVFQRKDQLREYLDTGVLMDSLISPELLMQIFYPNTPLHDGAVVIENNKIKAASCVLPLSSLGVLNEGPDHQMGLRHRASLGISENTDAVAVVVSEETGGISIAHMGKIVRDIKPEHLDTTLKPFLLEEGLDQQDDLFSLFRSWFVNGEKGKR